jgi:hypothetical protein
MEIFDRPPSCRAPHERGWAKTPMWGPLSWAAQYTIIGIHPYLLEFGSVIGCGPSFGGVMARGRLDV